MPAQKPRRSIQEVSTPRELILAVEMRFGIITGDLAANDNNAIVPGFLGPGSETCEDALAPDCPWAPHDDGLLWLNPPYANILPWAAKAASEAERGASIAMLAPASVGSNWFNVWVRPFAYVLELTPRVTFVGHSHPYPKDLILAVYTPEKFVGREAWHWRTSTAAPANDNGVDPRQMKFPILGAAEAS